MRSSRSGSTKQEKFFLTHVLVAIVDGNPHGNALLGYVLFFCMCVCGRDSHMQLPPQLTQQQKKFYNK
jgi:hypothetical protein